MAPTSALGAWQWEICARTSCRPRAANGPHPLAGSCQKCWLADLTLRSLTGAAVIQNVCCRFRGCLNLSWARSHKRVASQRSCWKQGSFQAVKLCVRQCPVNSWKLPRSIASSLQRKQNPMSRTVAEARWIILKPLLRCSFDTVTKLFTSISVIACGLFVRYPKPALCPQPLWLPEHGRHVTYAVLYGTSVGLSHVAVLAGLLAVCHPCRAPFRLNDIIRFQHLSALPSWSACPRESSPEAI